MKPKILVVDDEVSMQKLLKDTLTFSGFEVLLAGDGEQFKERALEQRPDVIILDLILGNQDGSAVYQELLGMGLDENIPVVFISALAEDRPPSPPRPNRKYALLGKPFDPEKLVRDLRKLVPAA